MYFNFAAAAKLLQSCPTLVTPWTAAHQAPPSAGFSRQEYWSGVPLPSPVCLFTCTKYLQLSASHLSQYLFPSKGTSLSYVKNSHLSYLYNADSISQELTTLALVC